MNMKLRITVIYISAISILISGCGQDAPLEPTNNPTPTFSATTTPTFTPNPTFTPTSTFTLTPTFTPTPEPIDLDLVHTSINQTLPQGAIRSQVQCNLDAAVWGSYDIQITVGKNYTKDLSAHIFTINNGVFSESVSSEDPSTPIIISGSGIIDVDDQATAFNRGIPFFITDVAFVDPLTINYTVISNPNVVVDFATAAIQWTNGNLIVWIDDIPHSFQSNPNPQHFTFKLESPPPKGSYLVIGAACAKSNQVELEALLNP